MNKDEKLHPEQISDYRWRLPKDPERGMRTDGVVFSSPRLWPHVQADAALEQVANVATLPGIVGPSLAMPDIHWGYGFPIGGVAAFDVDEGVISPGGVGYDINCGVNLSRTRLQLADLAPRLEKLADTLFAQVPCGVGKGGDLRLSPRELRRVAEKGAAWVVQRGLASAQDLETMEERGCLSSADPDLASDRACERGRDQLGTLGSGNHFVEVQVVDQVYDADAARALGLEEGQITVTIHSGSRGFGHQVCQEQLKSMGRAPQKYGIELVDRQLACAPVNSEEGRTYAAVMAAAANFAWANRLLLLSRVRGAFETVFGKGYGALGMGLVYDVSHNIAKFEEHPVAGKKRRLCLHRKGATRAFGPGDPRIPAAYRSVGQPVLVPGDMGRASHVLVGTATGMSESFGSTCHGAGRLLSRKAALKATKGRDLFAELAARGVLVRARSRKTVGEEAPEAYKDVDAVVEAAEGAGLARRGVRLRPLAVVKG